MTRSIEVGKASDFPEGSMKEVLADGREILVAHVEGRFYAVDSRCPHMGGRLSQGKLEGRVVTCPRHGSQFDLGDGHVVRWAQMPPIISALSKVVSPPKPIGTYQVKVEGDRILVEILSPPSKT